MFVDEARGGSDCPRLTHCFGDVGMRELLYVEISTVLAFCLPM